MLQGRVIDLAQVLEHADSGIQAGKIRILNTSEKLANKTLRLYVHPSPNVSKLFSNIKPRLQHLIGLAEFKSHLANQID